MTDPLVPPHHPPRPVPPGGLAHARTEGRRRRRRFQAVAGGSAFAVLLVAGLVVRNTGGEDRLGFTGGGGERPAPATASATPTPTVVSPRPGASASPSPVTGSAPASPRPSTGVATASPSQAGPRVIASEPHEDRTVAAACSGFQSENYQGGNGSCYRGVAAPETVAPGDEVEVAFRYCRETVQGPGSLTFDGQELSLVLRRSGTTYWAYGDGAVFTRGSHVLTAEVGHCYTWRVVWDGRVRGGGTPAPGTYTFAADLRARELHCCPDNNFSPLEISFEVT